MSGAEAGGADLQADAAGELGLKAIHGAEEVGAQVDGRGNMENIERAVAAFDGVGAAVLLGESVDLGPVDRAIHEGAGGDVGVELGEHSLGLAGGPALGAVGRKTEALQAGGLAKLEGDEGGEGEGRVEFGKKYLGLQGCGLLVEQGADDGGVGEGDHPC